MIETIDRFFMYIAKKIVIVGEFFGVNRKELAYHWVIVSLVCWYILPVIMLPKQLFLLIINIPIASALGTLYLWDIKNNFREDDILPNIINSKMSTRVGLCLMFLILGTLQALLPMPWEIRIMRLACPPFYSYFLLCQSPRNPLRLKDLVKKAVEKLQKQPVPQPQQNIA